MKVKSSFATSLLATAAAAVSKDGLWTSHDWSDSVDGVKDSDGDLTALNSFMEQKFRSMDTYQGDDLASVYMDQPNVKIIQSVLSEKQWNYLFPIANELYDYQSS